MTQDADVINDPSMKSFSDLGIIGGSGFYSLNEEKNGEPHQVLTPFDKTPVTLFAESSNGANIWFIPRHGESHAIPPHKINYRANLWALNEVGVKKIIAVNAVGGVSEKMGPGVLLMPDQIIDYSWGREHTFFDGSDEHNNVLNNHIDFTWPYDRNLIETLINAAQKLSINHIKGGVYACTQGPRLETAAEIIKLKSEGVDVVGMTGMPEAALARELNIRYASMALVVNWGAGLTDKEISIDDILKVLNGGIDRVRKIIALSLKELNCSVRR